MSLTRKHYVMLAKALWSAEPNRRRHDQAEDTWLDCVESIATYLAADNPRFDRARFIQAAQGDDK